MERFSVGVIVGITVLVVGLAALAVGTFAPSVSLGASVVICIASFLVGGAVGLNKN